MKRHVQISQRDVEQDMAKEEATQAVPERHWSNILDILHAIAVAGTAAENEDDLLEHATQIVGELWNLDNFGVMLLDDDEVLTLHPSYHCDNNMAHLESVSLGEGVTGQVAETGQPLYVGDVSQHPNYIAINPQVKSELCVPLVINENVIGVLDVESCEINSFTSEDQQVLITLAAQIATAIDRLRRTSEVKHRAQQLQTIYELGQKISRILQLDELLPTIARLITTTLDLHSVQIALVEGERLRWHASYSSDGKITDSTNELSIEKERIQALLNNRRPSTTTNPAEMIAPNVFDLEGAKTEIFLPLRIRTTIIGLLIITCKQSPETMMCDVALLEYLADQVAVAIQNARLFTATQEKTQELISLYETAIVTNSILEPRELVKRLYGQIESLLMPDDFYMVLYDQKKDELDVTFAMKPRQTAPKVSHLHRPLKDGGLTGWVMEEQQALLIKDMETETLPAPPQGKPEVRSWLGVPLIAYQELIGALVVESSQKDAFNLDHQRYLESITNQVAIVLTSARLHHQVIETAERLAILHSASQELISIRADAEEVYQAIHKTVSRLMKAEAFVIALLDKQKDQIYFPYLIDRGKRRKPRRIPSGSGISGEIIASGKSMVLPDMEQADREFHRFHFGDPVSVRSILAVPLRLRGRVFGMIAAESYQPNAYTAEDQRILEMLAFDVAIALENARLFIEEHKRRQELEAIRKATLQLTSSLELKPVLQAILKHALELVEGDDAHIFLYNGKTLEFGAARWADGERHEPFSEPRKDGLTYTVVKSGEKIAVEDISTHALFEKTKWEGAILGLPLLIDQRVIGVMNVAYTHTHTFTENELRVLSLLADHAALAIRNAHLFAESQARAADLTTALERLQELDTMKSQFIQNTSHELRTPVTLIRGHAELLDSGSLGRLSPDQHDSVAVIARRAKMLSQMLEDLNAILETETQETKWGPVDMIPLLKKLIKEFKIRAKQEGLTLKNIIKPENAIVLGNEIHLYRVVDNLLDNAMKFTMSGGSIVLRFHKEDQWGILEISDTGIGIPNNELTQIFERFYQVDGSMTRRYRGTGLGLALVKEITEAHGGNVSVKSTLGEGSKFTVKLPLLPQ